MSKSNNNCAVACCSNYGRKTTDVIYHRFPTNPELQNVWVSRCKREGKINVKIARVCSVHFLPEDYERDLRNELLGLPVRKHLRPNAIPSQHIPNWHAQQRDGTENTLEEQVSSVDVH